MKRAPRKKSSRIGQAVFRGHKSQYNFEVFPLTAEINDTPAIFVISRRIIDKFRKGHHATICLGETESVAAELKRHKRAKCVKQSAANVICILKENNEATRSNVVDDLKAARLFSCVRNADQPNIKSWQNVKTTRTRPKNVVSPPMEVKVAAKTRSTGTKLSAAKTVTKLTKTGKSQPAEVASKATGNKKTPSVKVSASKPAKRKSSRKPVSPAKPVTVPAKKAKKSHPTKALTKNAVQTKPAKKKSSKIVVAKVSKPKSTRAIAAVASNRLAAKRATSAAKAKPAVPAKRKSATKKPVAASPKRRTRVQSGLDSKRGQHRLSKPKKSVDRRAKSRTSGRSRSSKKAAA